MRHTSTTAPLTPAQKKAIHVYDVNNTFMEIVLETSLLKQSLAQGLWLSGPLSAPPLCSGLGRCGACKVRFITSPPPALDKEENILGKKAVEEGWRLACKHTLDSLFAEQNILDLALPQSFEQKKIIRLDSEAQECRLAIDIGTTSLAWQIVTAQGDILSQGSQLNPQMGAGADIISRLAVAMHSEGKAQLALRIQASVQDIINSIPSSTKLTHICLAANTAMTAIFLQKDIQSLAHAPYALPLQGHEMVRMFDWPQLYIPPQLAPFVGGDMSAGYAALMQRKDVAYPFLLADLGTNGEFILALSPQEALITSVPMGPSLEGIGLRFGHMVDESSGIVHAVRLSPTGITPLTLQKDAPQKICGTGYISLIHHLLKVGCLTADGVFAQAPERNTPFFHKIMAHRGTLHHGEQVLYLWPELTNTPMYLSGGDVEEVLKVKAAFSLAMSHLLEHAQLSPSSLQKIYIAGAMGTHVDFADLEGLGFVPQGMTARMQAVGNSALDGARYLLLDEKLRMHLAQWSKQCTLISLTEDEHFTENFMQHMNFSYTG